jgi:hypothetical protein
MLHRQDDCDSFALHRDQRLDAEGRGRPDSQGADADGSRLQSNVKGIEVTAATGLPWTYWLRRVATKVFTRTQCVFVRYNLW